MAATNINAFCLSHDEKLVFAGTLSGQIVVLDARTLAVVKTFQAHLGTIENVTCHPALPFIAAYGKDRRISIWSVGEEGALARIHDVPLLHVTPGDGEAPFPSTSQVLAFHDHEMRLVGHSGNAGLTEIRFDDKEFEILSCVRAHGKFDIVSRNPLGDKCDSSPAVSQGQIFIRTLNNLYCIGK